MSQQMRAWEEFAEYPEPLAALDSGDPAAALGGFATRHLLNLRYSYKNYADDDVIGFGVALWLMGDEGGAATLWSWVCDEAFKGRYTYSSSGTYLGGLLLWFAAVWLKDDEFLAEAAGLLDKLLRKKRPAMGSCFQSLMAKLLRKEVDLAEIQSAFSDAPHVRDSEERQALFYAGVRSYEDGDREMTRQLWQQARTPTDSQVELEHYLLVHERRRLDQG